MKKELLQDLAQLTKTQEQTNFYLLSQIMTYNKIGQFDIGNIKLENMASHPFKYLRGTAERYFQLFFQSLEYSGQEFHCDIKNSALITACTNDTHVGNFGFTGEDSSFITNDFDEYLKGNPFTDVLRYTSSLKFFIDDINNRISKNNLELRILHNLQDSFQELSSEEILSIIEENDFLLELIKEEVVDLQNFTLEDLQNRFVEILKVGIKERIKIEEYLNLEKLEDLFLKEYFKAIEKEKSIKFSKNNKMKKFLEKSKEKQIRENQLIKYTTYEGDKRVFNLENEKLIDFKQEKKDLIKNALNGVIHNELEILDIVKRKTAGVGSSHLDRYYILTINKLTDRYKLLEMKEQLKPVSLSFKEEFFTHFGIDLEKYEDIAPGTIHKEGVKLVLGETFDHEISSLKFNNKSFIVKTHFDSKQGFDEVKIFKYAKKEEDITLFLEEYLSLCAIALAESHLQGVRVQEHNMKEKQFQKRKEKFKSAIKSYKNDENFYRFVKSMTKNLSNLILEDYLLYSKEFHLYKGYIQGTIETNIQLQQPLELKTIIGVLKEIVYSPQFNKHLLQKQITYRQFYNLINIEEYTIEDKTLDEFYKESSFKESVLDLMRTFLAKEKAFVDKETKVELISSYENSLKKIETLF